MPTDGMKGEGEGRLSVGAGSGAAFFPQTVTWYAGRENPKFRHFQCPPVCEGP